MTEPATTKRHRSANWDMDEKKLMRDVIKPYLHIIESKKLTTEFNTAKFNAWREITEKFNKANDIKRNTRQIMTQWKINKNICKAKFAAHCVPQIGENLEILKSTTPPAPPLKMGVIKIKEEPQDNSSNLIELDSYNVMGTTLKGSKMTNVVITCAKPKTATLPLQYWHTRKSKLKRKMAMKRQHCMGKEGGALRSLNISDVEERIISLISNTSTDGSQDIPVSSPLTKVIRKEDGNNIQKLVVIPAIMQPPATTEQVEPKQEIQEQEIEDPLGIEDVVIPVPVEIPEITEEIVTEQMDDEYYDIDDQATPASPEAANDKMMEEVPEIGMTSTEDVSKSPERDAEKIPEEVPARSEITTEEVPLTNETTNEQIVADAEVPETTKAPRKPIKRRRKRKPANDGNNEINKPANEEEAEPRFLSFSQALYNDKAHYRKQENERQTAEHNLRMKCMSEQHREILKILKLQQEILRKQLDNGNASTST